MMHGTFHDTCNPDSNITYLIIDDPYCLRQQRYKLRMQATIQMFLRFHVRADSTRETAGTLGTFDVVAATVVKQFLLANRNNDVTNSEHVAVVLLDDGHFLLKKTQIRINEFCVLLFKCFKLAADSQIKCNAIHKGKITCFIFKRKF